MIVQVTRRQQAAPRGNRHAAAVSERILKQALGGPAEEFGRAVGVQVVDRERLHGFATAATKHRTVPLPVSIATGA